MGKLISKIITARSMIRVAGIAALALALAAGTALLHDSKGDAMQNTALKTAPTPPAIEAMQPKKFSTATFGLG